MRVLLILIVPFFLFANSYGLKELIDHAGQNNQLLKSKELNSRAKLKEADAQESAFWPTVDLGTSYTNNNIYSAVMPGETVTGYAAFGLELYDGGRKQALANAKGFEYQTSLFEKQAFSKSLTLDIVNNYYAIKKSKATLRSLKVASKELKAQIDRIRRFEQAGMATKEDVDKLQATYDDNAYLIENTQLAIETSRENLWLNTGIEAYKLRDNRFYEPKNVIFEPYEQTKILQNSTQTLKEQANAIDSGYMPQIVVKDQYSRSDYNRVESMPGFGGDSFLVDEQNTLIISANMRLFDHGKTKKESEALQYQSMAMESQKRHSELEQRMNFRLANKRLETIRAQLISSKSALRAAQSTYDVIVKKFEVGLVDNIAYLDALQKQTVAEARNKSTLYDYEIAKSIYYFYAGKNPKEYIR